MERVDCLCSAEYLRTHSRNRHRQMASSADLRARLLSHCSRFLDSRRLGSAATSEAFDRRRRSGAPLLLWGGLGLCRCSTDSGTALVGAAARTHLRYRASRRLPCHFGYHGCLGSARALAANASNPARRTRSVGLTLLRDLSFYCCGNRRAVQSSGNCLSGGWISPGPGAFPCPGKNDRHRWTLSAPV